MSEGQPIIKYLFCAFVVALIMVPTAAMAQTGRSLQGQLSLDVAPAVKALNLDITVSNHSIAVLPPPFGIIRPIQSSVTTRVTIAAGQSAANYYLSGIENDPVDYTVKIECIGCANFVQTQYFSPDGNKFGLSNDVYIDPDDLPAQLDLTALTQASIAGKINLAKPASRNLDFTLKVSNAANPGSILKTLNGLEIAEGASNLPYRIAGLQRSINAYRISLTCNNCFGLARREQVFSQALSAQSNHSGINFLISSEGTAVLSAILELLLLDEED